MTRAVTCLAARTLAAGESTGGRASKPIRLYHPNIVVSRADDRYEREPRYYCCQAAARVDRSAWGHAATAVPEGCPPICGLTRVIYTCAVCCYALADDSNEMNLLGLKIPDALFHEETTEGEANVVGLKMPDFLFHETPTEASDKEPSLFGWTLPKAVQSAVLGDSPPAAAPAAPVAAVGAAAAAAAGGAAPVPEV